MGLVVGVGHLADCVENDDPDSADSFRKELQQLNDFLISANLNQHNEPENCTFLYYELYGYSGLHYLRRIAAYLALRFVLPEPGNKDLDAEDAEDPCEDPVVAEYYQTVYQQLFEPDFVVNSFRPLSVDSVFSHLMFHSDSEGYYIPQNFSNVLFPPECLEIGYAIGSSQKLHEECTRLAAALELPLNLDPESDTFLEAVTSQQKSKIWMRYEIESSVCLRLYRASKHSLKTGAAILFC